MFNNLFRGKVIPGTFKSLGGGAVRLEVEQLKHLRGPLVVIADLGTVDILRFGKTRTVPAVSVWCVSGVKQQGRVKATDSTPLYHGVFLTEYPRAAIKKFILAINKPNLADRVAALGM